MSHLNNISKIVLILIALIFTIVIGQIVPKNQFSPYRLELDSTWVKEADVQDYLVDLNNDFKYEIIRHNHINKPGHSLELIWNNQLVVIAIFGKNAFIVSRFVKFADVNQDGMKELILVAADGHLTRLFIIEFDFKTGKNPPVKFISGIDIDSVSFQNNVPDAINYEILTNKSDVYFDLQAGYSIHPRNIYKYNFQTKKLIKTQRNSIVNRDLELFTYINHDYLLAKKVVVTANTFSPLQAEKFRTSKNADSVKIYEHIKNRIFQYGDFSSYILLYDENLGLAFKPVEFSGWTNYTLSGILWEDSVPHIISLTNNQLGDKIKRKLTLCSIHGDILQQVTATENYQQLFADNDELVLQFGRNIDIFSANLKLKQRVSGLTFVSGFYELSSDKGKELIAFEKNRLIIFSDDFSRKTTLNIAQEFAPYPENNKIDILKKEGKTCFLFNTHLFYYLFSYEKNELAILKYPFYLVIFLFWFGLLFLLLHVNSRRLEKEKRQLEKIVSERTAELKSKNSELAAKNEEIQVQSEKITDQYQRLEKLDSFKETLTHTLVHDLKNPLNQILSNSSSQSVSHPAKKMLRLITNMLDVEKYEHTEFKLGKERHSLRNILEEVINGQEISLKEKNLGLHFYFADYEIFADKEVMIRVFDNLLSNAIRYSPLNRNIDVFAEQSGDDTIKISMRNYGEPISDEALPYIFDKYRHFGENERNSYRSTGLGLTFCKMAVEAHGGEIGVWCNPEEGCNFWFTVPFSSKIGEFDENENPAHNFRGKLKLSETDFNLLIEVINQIKEFEIYEISRFHEVLDPLKETSGSAMNEWISYIYSAINIQNKDEFNRLINLAENGQTENSDC